MAGANKGIYIARSFREIGYNVTILSNAKALGKSRVKKETIELDSDGIVLHTFASLGNGNRIKNIINALYGLVQLFFFILLYVKKKDIVCVYHSLGYRGLFHFVRKVKRFKYILEVEELYKYFVANTSNYASKEFRVFEEPDAFIFSNLLLGKEVNRFNKPQIIVNGAYRTENNKKTVENREDLILVYAGSLEKQKGIGIILKFAEYVNENVEIRIIGFGEHDDVNYVRENVELLNKKGTKIRYDGIKTGMEYTKYLQQCDIGLCIQDNTDDFNLYEFPSKVISYMACGLNVITNDLIQIRTSELAKYINIMETNDIIEMADYINNRRFECYDVSEVLKKVDREFIGNIKLLVESV